MSDVATRFHENWLGLVQPIDGLVVSIPALVAAECMQQQAPTVQRQLIELCPTEGDGRPCIADLWTVLEQILQLGRAAFDVGDAQPEDLQLYVPEGGQTLRPTAALRKLDDDAATESAAEPVTMDDSTPASRAGSKYEMLLWQLPDGITLDKPETQTGTWEYPPAAKFDRLLRECRVPIGLLTNGQHLRLFYAPHGESSGTITFRLEEMVQVGGRPILDAFIMLLSDHRWFGAEPGRRLPAILKDSRARQADVTNTLADQMFEALAILLQGFEAAAERDGDQLLREALAREDDHLYNGLLTLLLRLVFVLYAEDRGLMPVEHEVYGQHLSVLALFDALQADHGAFPDTMARRFGAYPRVLALFRAVFFGVCAGEMSMPPRRGVLFDPGAYPFLEGRSSVAPPVHPAALAATHVPSVSDETMHLVLKKLLLLGGQRLSYRALEVEQIGSVYEALMGYHVVRVATPSVCLKGAKVWVAAAEVTDVDPGRRARWFEELGLAKAQAKKLADALTNTNGESEILEVLERLAAPKSRTVPAEALVIQPGEERRRTSSHYTPRSLTEPIVRRTLEPLIVAMGGEPRSEQLLRLKICDLAMGSGAFLVAACRFLADQLVAAWTREEVIKEIVKGYENPLMHARRLVAQRCLYGVDKNAFAVNLAKLSLWLETLAKDQPFTFLDHSLRCGDSLIGLSLAQIKRFDWAPDDKATASVETAPRNTTGKHQLDLFASIIERALLRAHDARQRLLDLAEVSGNHGDIGSEKARLLGEAEQALERTRVIADVLVGAFFAQETEKSRISELHQRRLAIESWLVTDEKTPPPLEIIRWLTDMRAKHLPFHWGIEFPEVFSDMRQDPLEGDSVNGQALMDAFFGNPPFLGQSQLLSRHGSGFRDFLRTIHPGTMGKTDIVAHFLRRASHLLGSHGTLGFVTTNSVSQGDTRETGLQEICRQGGEVYDATPSLEWPGEASVTVALVHVAFGNARHSCSKRLSGTSVTSINSRLLPAPERENPARLRENSDLYFLGSNIYGPGFILTASERAQLIATNPSNGDLIHSYMGGEELNTSPTQSPDRYVINFGKRSLEEARAWPDLLAIVEREVRPVRESVNSTTGMGGHGRKYWWQFMARSDLLYAALSGKTRCLAISQVSKHLVFAWQPTDRIFAHTMYIFPLDEGRHFALLQSRVHEVWARLHSSSLAERLRYTPTDCFETFPMASGNALLDQAGESLHEKRAALMKDDNIGLTRVYNMLKDAACNDPRVVQLRSLHMEVDELVLSAYGWSDIPVPPLEAHPRETRRQRFEDAVADRLFTLNQQRAVELDSLGNSPSSRLRTQ